LLRLQGSIKVRAKAAGRRPFHQDILEEGPLLKAQLTRRFVALVAAAGISAASILAPAAQAQVAQVALTAQSVEGLIASYGPVKAAAEQLKAQYGEPAGGTGNDPAAGWSAWLAVGGAKGALDAAVQPHGFADFLSWVQVMTSVAMAYAFAKDGGQMDTQMAQAIEQINNSPGMSAAQKQMMIQQIQGSMQAVQTMRPSQENIDAVKPYVGQLASLFGT
jgi:hypothetical protein